MTDRNKIILICGGREFDDLDLVEETLLGRLNIRAPTQIIHGDARGADFLARVFCKYWGIPEQRYPADWERYGKRAGVVRNELMLSRNPDLVVAFPGGNGTAHMVRIAKEAGVEVIEVAPTES